MDGLELYSVDDLINELMKRETFGGIIIKNSQERKGPTSKKMSLTFRSKYSKAATSIILLKIARTLSSDERI